MCLCLLTLACAMPITPVLAALAAPVRYLEAITGLSATRTTGSLSSTEARRGRRESALPLLLRLRLSLLLLLVLVLVLAVEEEAAARGRSPLLRRRRGGCCCSCSSLLLLLLLFLLLLLLLREEGEGAAVLWLMLLRVRLMLLRGGSSATSMPLSRLGIALCPLRDAAGEVDGRPALHRRLWVSLCFGGALRKASVTTGWLASASSSLVAMKAPCRLRQSLRWCRVLMSERLLSLAMSAFLMYAACTRSQTLGWSSTSWVGHEQSLLLLLMVGAAFAKARRESGEVDADIVVMVRTGVVGVCVCACVCVKKSGWWLLVG